MWEHALSVLRCPRCRGSLSLERVPDRSPAGEWIEDGALLCGPCKCIFPVSAGVPILLTYTTRRAQRAHDSWNSELRDRLRNQDFKLPVDHPPRGEELVGASFSAEWDDYDYGATLWTAPLQDRAQTFRGECSLENGDLAGKTFCELGCGLGILTNEAAAGLGAEAWGVDLSSAVFRAARQFKTNPRLHFVQASVFALPFAPNHFDFVYSHGVLHHTWSTHEAVRRAVKLLRPNGKIYLWLYGHADVHISPMRRLAFGAEQLTRPIIARLPSSIATLVLLPLVPLYQLASIAGQRSGTHATRYTVQQALHAARDRFTPLFAHRHDFEEVQGWLQGEGMQEFHRVAGSEVTPSWSLAMDRNVAIRASRGAAMN